MTTLTHPFTLPNGTTLKNRMAKASMTERIALPDHLPNEKHIRLYESWAEQGAGLILTGNIIVDKRYLEASANVVIESDSPEAPFKKWTEAVTQHGAQFWAQLGHAGRQATIFGTLRPISASDIKLKKVGLFARPRAMTEVEIIDVENRFVEAAKFCQRVGFTGIELHAAHGYLLSQFLSPRTNKRTDKWGGSIENRARLLLNIVERTRKEVGSEFGVAVKLNSADFQRGGFDEADAFAVISALEERGIDFLEVSGGTYEDVTFFTKNGLKQSTQDREAYFLDFAKELRQKSKLPIMVTGGFRSRSFCDQALENNELDIVGFARPFLLHNEFAQEFLAGTLEKVVDPKINSPLAAYWDFTVAGYYDYQILQIAEGKPVNLDFPGWLSLIRMSSNELTKGVKNRLFG